MRVLVVEPNRAQRELAISFLSSGGHEVESAVEVQGANVRLASRWPDVVFLSWGAASSAAFLKRLRSAEPHHTWVVTTSERGAPDAISSIRQGSDDYVRSPFCREELLLRVEGITRIQRWAQKASSPVASVDWSTGPRLDALVAYRDARRILIPDLETVLGTTLTASTCANPLDRVAVSSSLPLTLAGNGQEARLCIGLDALSVRDIGRSLFGTDAPPPEAILDVVRELANTAAGTFKLVALDEGITLTTGLPKSFTGSPPVSESTVQNQTFNLVGSELPVRIGVSIGVSTVKPSASTVGTLTEGMVLARDLLSETGALLLPVGTRLTTNQIARVGRVLAPDTTVEVVLSAA